MRRAFFYPPSYMPNYVPIQRISPFFMRPAQPLPMPPLPNAVEPPALTQATLPQAAPPLPSFLANAQSLFNQAQQFTPYFQQAAPMLKNLPALWRMYRGFKDNKEESSSLVAPRKKQKAPRQTVKTRPSMPKIYQPPYDF